MSLHLNPLRAKIVTNIRSAGGWMVVKAGKEGEGRTKGDERILGDREFVESVLKEADETIERRQWLKAQGYDFQKAN